MTAQDEALHKYFYSGEESWKSQTLAKYQRIIYRDLKEIELEDMPKIELYKIIYSALILSGLSTAWVNHISKKEDV